VAAVPFFNSINYASFHEDGRSERIALKLRPTDRVLCLTGSGARPLELLLDGPPKEIVALDWNPAQGYLLELKIAVFQAMQYEEAMGFLGLLPHPQRADRYRDLRDTISTEAQAFWDRRQKSISAGFFFDGRWERFLERLSRVSRLTRGRVINELIQSNSVAEQHATWTNRWDGILWRLFLRTVSHRLFVKFLLREPGMEFVLNDVSISDYLSSRFEQASQTFLFRDSPWMWALMKGRIEIDGPLPEHLQFANYETIKPRLNAITIACGGLKETLAVDETGYDAYSLSDFASYCDQPTHAEIWRLLLERSHAEARFCERRFLVKYPLQPSIESLLRVDHELADQLDREDRSVVYSFLVAQKNK